MRISERPLAFISISTSSLNALHGRISELTIYRLNNSSSFNSIIDSHYFNFAETDFNAVARDIAALLDQHILVTEHGRWVQSFLKNELRRAGINQTFYVLCLRKFFKFLTTLSNEQIAAFGEKPFFLNHLQLPQPSTVEQQVVQWIQLWGEILSICPKKIIDYYLHSSVMSSSIPAALQNLDWQNMHDQHGVYLIYGENDLPVYIGKSNHVRQRLLSHFSSDHRIAKEMSLSMQAKRLEIIPCAGELDALITESHLIKQLKPTLNRQLRSSKSLFSWRLSLNDHGYLQLSLVSQKALQKSPINELSCDSLYGFFTTKREAEGKLRSLLSGSALCQQTLGLIKGQHGKPCFDRQLKRCSGACVFELSAEQHNQQLYQLLSKIKIADWPVTGIGKIKEGNKYHLIQNWRYLGSTTNAEAFEQLIKKPSVNVFDKDTYKILYKFKHLIEPI